MKKFKRFVGLAIGAVMMLGTVPPASAENSVDTAAAGSKTVTNYDTEKYYYLNEDFSAYVGGVPAQWQATKLSNSTLESAKDSGVDSKGTVLKMPRGAVSSYMNKFETFQSGKLNVEFDIKASGKGWGVGFIREADSKPEDYEKHLAIGNLASDSGASDVYTSAEWNNDNTGLNLSTKKENAIDNTGWNHVSITVDMTSEKYNFEITKADKTKETFSAVHPNYHYSDNDGHWKTRWYDVIKTGTEEVQESYKCGLNGIRLYSDGTNDVEFDNIRVYTDNSNYISEDFDTYTGNFHLPAGYYRVNDIFNVPTTTVNVTNGKGYNETSNPNDKGVKIAGKEDRIRIRLPRPITDLKNNELVMEFDVKQNNTEGALGIALYPKEKFYGKGGNAPSITDGQYSDTVIRVENNALIYHAKRWTGTKTNFKKDDTPLMLNPSAWSHIKLVFNKEGVTASVGEGENIITSALVKDDYAYNQLLNYTNVFGIAFGIENGKSGDTDIDNLKIYPLDSVTKPSVISTKTVMSDGFETDLADGVTEIPNLTKAIEIKFSEPINETADTLANKVTLTDKAGAPLATTRELSDDKKTYTLNLNAVPSAGSYATLKMSSDIKGKSSLAQLTNPVSKALNFKGKIEINSMTLNNDKTKIVISGKNTTGEKDNTTYNYIVGTYETIDGSDVLKNVTVEKLEIPNGEFTIKKEIPSINTGQKYKAFIWTAEVNKPVVNAIK